MTEIAITTTMSRATARNNICFLPRSLAFGRKTPRRSGWTRVLWIEILSRVSLFRWQVRDSLLHVLEKATKLRAKAAELQ